jgi:hydroxymethylbilane synthase
MNRDIIIGTRGSALAMRQAGLVKALLEKLHPAAQVSLKIIKTSGDGLIDVPLAGAGGKGLFVKELEDSLLKGQTHIAVHSMKDVPAELPAGLHISAILTREDPGDVLVAPAGNRGCSFKTLSEGSVIGTSSLRRLCQLLNIRPDLRIAGLRGNIDTRLKKLDEGRFDAIILAAAGLKRLGLEERITELLSFGICLPAIAQGAIGIECKTYDEINELLAPLNDHDTALCVKAERKFLKALGGGCQAPVAANARLIKESGSAETRNMGGTIRKMSCREEKQKAEERPAILIMDGLVGNPSGSIIIRDSVKGSPADAESLGAALAEKLLNLGAGEILDEIYGGGRA